MKFFWSNNFTQRFENLSLEFKNIMTRDYRKENLPGYVMSPLLDLAQLSENDVFSTTTFHLLTKTIRKSGFPKLASIIFLSDMLFQKLASLPSRGGIYIPPLEHGQDSVTAPTHREQQKFQYVACKAKS